MKFCLRNDFHPFHKKKTALIAADKLKKGKK